MTNIPSTIGNYRLEHELGRGATSRVWMGRHSFLHERVVAVKLLLSHDEENVLRFTREAEITSQLRHPNIIQIYDHATPTTGYPYTVMELVSGGSLRQRIEKSGRLPLAEAIHIFRQIGSALDYAHSRGIVHRDVSPGNVLLDTSANRALIADFGIARQPNQRHTSTDMIMGTPGFFSPEHARSATLVTSASDLYGLGVILYYMLTGQLPWDEPPAHPDYRFDQPMTLAQRGVELPSELDQIMRTMLAYDPQKRYPSAGTAMAALDRAIAKAGITLDDAPAAVTASAAVRAINTAPSFQSQGLTESEVEQALAADLHRDAFERTRTRAEDMRDPLRLAQLLDDWSKAGGRWEFRKQQFGRVINLREVRSRNVYFYKLDVLLETRTEPQEVEEPDANAATFPLSKETNRWQVKLPAAAEFKDDAGRAEVIPGSERVATCARCNGSGYEVCAECKGSRRVLITRPIAAIEAKNDNVAMRRDQTAPTLSGGGATAVVPDTSHVKQVLVPCTACNGHGQSKCERCDGIGRLVQRKAFTWSRRATQAASHDDLPRLDEERIRKETDAVEVYSEVYTHGGFKREWTAIAGLKLLIDNVRQQLDADTRVVRAQVTIEAIPFTEVTLDLGHNDVAIEGGGERAHDDAVHTLQIYGFDNHINIGSFAYDGHLKLLFFWSILATVAVVLLTLGLVLPIFF